MPIWMPLWLPRFLVMPEVYSGLGITPPGAQVSLTVQEGGGRPRTVRLGRLAGKRSSLSGGQTAGDELPHPRNPRHVLE